MDRYSFGKLTGKQDLVGKYICLLGHCKFGYQRMLEYPHNMFHYTIALEDKHKQEVFYPIFGH
jgi:hypothetical protein